MTKDVLVSISGKHIDIMDDPARGYEVGEDGIEVVTPANYYCRNGKHYILYDEVLEGMAGTIKNKIKITGTDCLEIMKSGVTSSHMVFEKNKKNSKKLLTVYIVFGIVPIVATISKTYNRNAICGSVGTGRRARLRIL